LSEQIKQSGQSVIVYDDALISHIEAEWFNPGYWHSATRKSGAGVGRGGVLFIEHEQQHWVLRHYYRGGMVGRLTADSFFWTGLNQTRALREWRLLFELYKQGLPVPQPVGARVIQRGIFYTADLLTARLPGVKAFSHCLKEKAVDAATWKNVGSLIARFHSAGVYHADLNAHNIQVGADQSIYLLDFDRGRFMPTGGGWQQGNLKRLKRSLNKLSGNGQFEFAEGDWQLLLESYQAAMV